MAEDRDYYCAEVEGFFTVQQRLTIPELLHSVRMQDWIKRYSLHQEKDPDHM
jgi:hypothetical protein